MITAQFILFFFAFLIICMFVMGALNRDLRDKRYLSTMGCLLSVMLISPMPITPHFHLNLQLLYVPYCQTA